MNSLSDPRNALRSLGFRFSYWLCITVVLRSSSVAADCGKMQVLERGGISCSLIKDIVSAHNELRQSVAKGLVNNQPAASDMREMYWDEELASEAQDWANRCTFAHNRKEDREVARFPVGQNLALTKSIDIYNESDKEFRSRIVSWYNEYKHFQFGPLWMSKGSPPVGHYTQVVWASTYLIGCGYSKYKSPSNITHRLYVCNYGPMGNKMRDEPYRRGALNCPDNLIPSKTYPGLCSLREPVADPCDTEGETTITYAENDSTRRKEEDKAINTRRFLSPNSSFVREMDTPQEREKSTDDDSKATLNGNNVVFNFFFSSTNQRR